MTFCQTPLSCLLFEWMRAVNRFVGRRQAAHKSRFGAIEFMWPLFMVCLGNTASRVLLRKQDAFFFPGTKFVLFFSLKWCFFMFFQYHSARILCKAYMYSFHYSMGLNTLLIKEKPTICQWFTHLYVFFFTIHTQFHQLWHNFGPQLCLSSFKKDYY